MSYEKNTIEEVMQGDGNVFSIIGRVNKALRHSGATDEFCLTYRDRAVSDFETYQEVLHFSANTLEEAGFLWGDRQLTNRERLAEAVASGKYDTMTVLELKKYLNI